MSNKYNLQQMALAACILTRTPVMLWGQPGVGKTAVLNEIARQYSMHMETVILSQREPGDLLGIPYIYEGEMRVSVPDFARRIFEKESEGQSSILFLDEYSTAPPSMQAASLRLTAERVVGTGIKLPASTVIVAAANPPSIASGGFAITPPAANRFIHLPWDMPLEVLLSGLEGEWAKVSMPIAPQGWKNALKNTKSLVAAFLAGKRSQSYVSASLDSLESAASLTGNFKPSDLGFPSPRMWVDYVSPVVAVCLFGSVKQGKIPVGVIRLLVEGCVGEAISNEFLAFLSQLDLPNPVPVLEGKAKWTPAPNMRPDVISAISRSFVKAYLDNPGVDSWVRLGSVLADIAQNNPDIALPQIKQWLGARPEGALPPRKAVEKIVPYLDAIEG